MKWLNINCYNITEEELIEEEVIELEDGIIVFEFAVCSV